MLRAPRFAQELLPPLSFFTTAPSLSNLVSVVPTGATLLRQLGLLSLFWPKDGISVESKNNKSLLAAPAPPLERADIRSTFTRLPIYPDHKTRRSQIGEVRKTSRRTTSTPRPTPPPPPPSTTTLPSPLHRPRRPTTPPPHPPSPAGARASCQMPWPGSGRRGRKSPKRGPLAPRSSRPPRESSSNSNSNNSPRWPLRWRRRRGPLMVVCLYSIITLSSTSASEIPFLCSSKYL